jgi:CRP-like cAMP-binding protein
MDNEIARYLSKYIEISEELERALSENLLIRKYPKGAVLLKEGELCSECFFIIKGLIRSYYLNEVEEITADFYMEEQVVSPSCYGTKTPSRLYLECLEETIAYVGTPELESEMYLKYPELVSMSQAMGKNYVQLQGQL